MPSIKKLLQAAAGNAGESLYVEDVFSTYLYTGEGAGTTITNGIDLADAGGLVWAKNRGTATGHYLFDTASNGALLLQSNTTGAGIAVSPPYMVAQSTGYTTGGADSGWNGTGQDMVSWTFRKAEKFFDVVTYTGNGVAGREIAHNLGSAPAVIIIKSVSFANNWLYNHNFGASGYDLLYLDLTNAKSSQTYASGAIQAQPTDSSFTLKNSSSVNGDGNTYVAYLFASDAGGFGDDDENIIKCGSYTGATSGTNVIDLGFEPQWVMIKGIDRACDWVIFDNMRPWPTNGTTSFLRANTSGVEASNFGNVLNITSTGFSIPSTSTGNVNEYNEGYIYIAIRRPMKTPESGTEVFTPTFGTGSGFNFIAGFPVDMAIIKEKNGVDTSYASARLTSGTLLTTASTAAEFNAPFAVFDSQVGYFEGSLGSNYIGWMFKRATGFFDVVAYTGDGTLPQNIAHNLGVIPELMIVRSRNLERNWATYNSYSGATQYMNLNTDAISNTSSFRWYNTEPTSTVFSVGGTSNTSGDTYIAYLFATLAGVSKVGSYTGTGADLNVDCGFSAGARFILIKRSDSTGDWYVLGQRERYCCR
jgi:hypothetical protein